MKSPIAYGCGVFFLLAATVMLIVTSVSLPLLSNTEFIRVHVKSGNITQGTVTSSDISELKVSGVVFYVYG